MFKINFDEWVSNNIISMREIADRTGVNINTLYRIKKYKVIGTGTIRKIQVVYPDITKYLEGVK